MAEIIGAKTLDDYSAVLYTDNSKEMINLRLDFDGGFPDLLHKFSQFCTLNNISYDMVKDEQRNFLFQFQNTRVYIEDPFSQSPNFYLAAYSKHGSEFVTFYKMFKQFFENNQLDLSPVDDLIFSKKTQELIRKGEEQVIGRLTPKASPPITQTTQVYKEMELEAQRLIADTDTQFKKELLTNRGIDLYKALREGDDKRTRRLMTQYLIIASQLNINPKPGLEAILNSD